MNAVLVASGLLGIVVACLHGYLGEARLIAPATFANAQARALVSAIWQFSTVTWIAAGGVIAVAPWLFTDHQRMIGVALACLPLTYGMIANAWITNGRHFGWKAMAVVVVLAMIGAAA